VRAREREREGLHSVAETDHRHGARVARTFIGGQGAPVPAEEGRPGAGDVQRVAGAQVAVLR